MARLEGLIEGSGLFRRAELSAAAGDQPVARRRFGASCGSRGPGVTRDTAEARFVGFTVGEFSSDS